MSCHSVLIGEKEQERVGPEKGRNLKNQLCHSNEKETQRLKKKPEESPRFPPTARALGSTQDNPNGKEHTVFFVKTDI